MASQKWSRDDYFIIIIIIFHNCYRGNDSIFNEN
jgi:hypothetical protein